VLAISGDPAASKPPLWTSNERLEGGFAGSPPQTSFSSNSGVSHELTATAALHGRE
jgi:hypothetical protein